MAGIIRSTQLYNQHWGINKVNSKCLIMNQRQPVLKFSVYKYQVVVNGPFFVNWS